MFRHTAHLKSCPHWKRMISENKCEQERTENASKCLSLFQRALIPGPPFLIGACTVVVAFLVALFIPEKPSCSSSSSHLSLSDKPRPESKESMSSLAGVHINTPLPGSDEETPPTASDEDFEPLLQDSIVWLRAEKSAQDGAWLSDSLFIDKEAVIHFQAGTKCSFIVKRLTARSSNRSISLPEGNISYLGAEVTTSDEWPIRMFLHKSAGTISC